MLVMRFDRPMQCLKISEGTLPENDRFQRHFLFNSLNFDAISILSTQDDAP